MNNLTSGNSAASTGNTGSNQQNPTQEQPRLQLPSSFIDLLTSLIRTPSVVGAEHSFFRVLQRELEERGANVTWYEGVLVAQGEKPDSVMFSAHIDRHGLMCTGPNEFQYAAFVAGARSDLLGNSVGELLMKKIVDRFASETVFAYEPWSGAYRGQGIIDRTYICEYRNNLIFELKGMEHLVAGTPVAFTDRLKITEEALVGQLDNVLTAAALVYMFERGFQGTMFFTAQEEAGKSWRYLLEWFRRFGGSTNRLIVVDTSPYPDLEAAKQQNLVLRNKDANASFNSELTAKLVALCEENDISYQFKDRYVEQKNAEQVARGEEPSSIGSTEMGRIIAASNGLVDGTTLQIPTSGYHTLSESAPIESVVAFLKMLSLLANLKRKPKTAST
ncbi:peptidase M42 [Alkalimarinus sediminis]|uniref:Peptidase M42 n=1 Tax=Alkalimarinus sediminis TaxID=1632866 RepID=A0A9E8HG97_9ALTE|nr:peptidase M42 [Alkalimarinus sediminis]UZW73675.1 peptidase M42 [Alkalimarinus sediminis]